MNDRDCMKPGRKELLRELNEVSFAANEAQLYLDTHPCDEEAMICFQTYSQKRNDLMKKYSKMYGPLTVDHVDMSCTEHWNWVCEPWPWKEGGC